MTTSDKVSIDFTMPHISTYILAREEDNIILHKLK